MNDEDFSLLKKEVDSIQIQLAKESGSWMSKPSNIMALVALLLSFAATLISAYNSHAQDKRENRKEVTQLIQKISNLPIKKIELSKRYEEEEKAVDKITDFLKLEATTVAIQAAELMERFPNTFSSSEFRIVGAALEQSNINQKATRFYEQAMSKAASSANYLAACYSFGSFLFSERDIAKGREIFQKALDMTWSKFPESDNRVIRANAYATYDMWSKLERRANNIEKADELSKKAGLILEEFLGKDATKKLEDLLSGSTSDINKAKQPSKE